MFCFDQFSLLIISNFPIFAKNACLSLKEKASLSIKFKRQQLDFLFAKNCSPFSWLGFVAGG